MHVVGSRQEGLLTSGLLVTTWDFCLKSRWWGPWLKVKFSRLRIAIASSRQNHGIMREMFVLCLSLQYPTGTIPELGKTVIDWRDMSWVTSDCSWHPLPPPCMHGNSFELCSKLWFRVVSSRWEKFYWCCSGKDCSHCSAKDSLIISWSGCSFLLLFQSSIWTRLQKAAVCCSMWQSQHGLWTISFLLFFLMNTGLPSLNSREKELCSWSLVLYHL